MSWLVCSSVVVCTQHRRGYPDEDAWDPSHTGTKPTKATRLGCPHTPRRVSNAVNHRVPQSIAVPALLSQRWSVIKGYLYRASVQKLLITSTCTGVMRPVPQGESLSPVRINVVVADHKPIHARRKRLANNWTTPDGKSGGTYGGSLSVG